MINMNSVIERLETEKKELDAKLDKLKQFMITEVNGEYDKNGKQLYKKTKKFLSLTPEMQSLMKDQYDFMRAYSKILSKRIGILKKETNEEIKSVKSLDFPKNDGVTEGEGRAMNFSKELLALLKKYKATFDGTYYEGDNDSNVRYCTDWFFNGESVEIECKTLYDLFR